MELFDSHCHIDDARFDGDREELHARMLAGGVTRWAVVGTDLASSAHAADYAEQYPGAVTVAGIYPGDCGGYRGDADLAELAALTRRPKVKAIGEIGLDYYWQDNPPREHQQRVCADQIELAWKLGLPCAFHVRDAHPDMLALLKAHRDHLTGGIMHCYSGSWELAVEYLALGYHLSLAGPVTYKNARHPAEVAVRCPLDRLLIETDSPYLTPVPHRGERNEPTYVIHTARRIAELRGIPAEEVAAASFANACRVYGVED